MLRAERPSRPRSLRIRVREAISVVAVLSLLLFGIPLAVVLDRLIASQALTGLQRDATRGIALVPDNALQAKTAPQLPASSSHSRIGAYDLSGVRVAGQGPATSELARRIKDGREHDGHDSGDLSVVVPVLSDTAIAGSVRAALPLNRLHGRVYRAWALLAALALVVIAVALALARRAATRISGPFEELTAAARALGAGDYDVHLRHWAMPEADAAAQALQQSGRQIDALIHHEREFVNDASHQLRTPIAALLLALEQDTPDYGSAINSAHQLRSTIADLTSLRGSSETGSCDAHTVVAEAIQNWSTSDRPIALRYDQPQQVAIAAAALRQSLDVLLDNAVRHGAGPITVTVEPYGASVIVEVADQGGGFTDDSQPGTGLQLATRLVERGGGSLVIRRRAPHPRVALLIPTLSSPAPARR